VKDLSSKCMQSEKKKSKRKERIRAEDERGARSLPEARRKMTGERRNQMIQ